MITHLMILLLLLMIAAAFAALQTPNLLSAVISMGAVGFGVSMAYILLRAPDAAIPHIVVEILTLLLLIRATIWRGVHFVTGQRDVFGSAVALGLVIILLILLLPVFNALPFGHAATWSQSPAGQFDLASTYYLNKGLQDTGAANITTAVLLSYRVYDTLGEATVLFTAIVGALVLLRRQARKPLEEN